jgi:branched-chain amino acid transport system ATP-binding protein
MTRPILAVEEITKRFGGLYAVREASLTVEVGRITAVIGPNGAGKTTLFALIAGFQAPDHGRILFGNDDITGQPAHRLARQGIARTFQIVQPFAGLSVLENVAVGAHLHFARRAEALAAAEEVAKLVGLEKVLNQWQGESGSSLPGRWQRRRSCCCSTRYWLASILRKYTACFR